MTFVCGTLLALSLLTPAQAQTPDRRAEAERLAQAGDYARALQQFQAIAAANPDDIEARLWIARIHSRMGHPERAADVYRSIVATAPQNVDALVGLGTALTDQGRLADASDALNRAEAIAADSPVVLAAQGRAHGLAEHTTLALAYYQRALTIDPANARIRADYDALRARRAHRLEGTYYFEHYNADVPDTHSGILEFNGRVADTVRLFVAAQHQRKFDRDEDRAGGGIELVPHRNIRVRSGALFANDTAILPDADVSADAHSAGLKFGWTAGIRYLHFADTTTVLWSPGIIIAPDEALELTLRYFHSHTSFRRLQGDEGNSGFSARATFRTAPRVRVTAGYVRGYEGLAIITSERLTELDANTLQGALLFDPIPMFSAGAAYQHEWRAHDVNVGTLSLFFVKRF